MSTTMQRVLRMNTPDFEMAKMILELNPKSALVSRLSELAGNSQNHEFIRECARQTARQRHDSRGAGSQRKRDGRSSAEVHALTGSAEIVDHHLAASGRVPDR